MSSSLDSLQHDFRILCSSFFYFPYLKIFGRNVYWFIQCVRKVAVQLGYGRVQFKCDGSRWRTGGEVRKVAVNLIKVLQVMSTGVCTGLIPFNFIRKHFLQICLCLSAQRLSERTVLQPTTLFLSRTLLHRISEWLVNSELERKDRVLFGCSSLHLVLKNLG